MHPMDLAFIHLCILLSVWFLFPDIYCTETNPFSLAISYWFLRTGCTEERSFRKFFLLNEHFDSLHLKTLHCQGHWGRSLAVISTCSQKSCVCFEPDLESLQIFALSVYPGVSWDVSCLSDKFSSTWLNVWINHPCICMICMKTRQYLLQLDLGSLLFIPDLSDGILCCLCQATSVLFPFL